MWIEIKKKWFFISSSIFLSGLFFRNQKVHYRIKRNRNVECLVCVWELCNMEMNPWRSVHCNEFWIWKEFTNAFTHSSGFTNYIFILIYFVLIICLLFDLLCLLILLTRINVFFSSNFIAVVTFLFLAMLLLFFFSLLVIRFIVQLLENLDLRLTFEKYCEILF